MPFLVPFFPLKRRGMAKSRKSAKRKLVVASSVESPKAKTATRHQKTLTLELLQPMVTGMGLKDRMTVRAVCKQLLNAERGAGELI
ncbi:hypothetical protein PMAYCL1PPCAC_05593, partial [Pristionchus mayeri]